MRLIYSAFASLVWLCLKLLSLSNKKLKEFTQGRTSASESSELEDPIWVHCASVGEFEQARPVIELIKASHPEQDILLTFFSPSGFNHLSSYELVEHVCYAPFDTPAQVKAFLTTYKPKVLLLIKYEFWKNMLYFCSKNSIPVFSVSAIFRQNQRFFNWYGSLFKADLRRITHFFVQNESSRLLLNSIEINKTTVTGDTRFDRVVAIAEKSMEVESIKKYCEHTHVIIAGSTWAQDEEALVNAYDQLDSDWKLIIAPHEVNAERIQEVLERFKHHSPACLSGAKDNELKRSRVLIIDSIGLLNRTYRHADLCYVGGAFGAGLHNSLEAAVWGKPLVHGTNYDKFQEATDLAQLGGSLPAKTIVDATKNLLILAKDEALRTKMGSAAQHYVHRNKGASLKVFSILESEGIF
ncbi:MAG: 3-deoxy-D-manno-octulosonic acid transferase [Flavobacteriales bacterium]